MFQRERERGGRGGAEAGYLLHFMSSLHLWLEGFSHNKPRRKTHKHTHNTGMSVALIIAELASYIIYFLIYIHMFTFTSIDIDKFTLINIYHRSRAKWLVVGGQRPPNKLRNDYNSGSYLRWRKVVSHLGSYWYCALSLSHHQIVEKVGGGGVKSEYLNLHSSYYKCDWLIGLLEAMISWRFWPLFWGFTWLLGAIYIYIYI